MKSPYPRKGLEWSSLIAKAGLAKMHPDRGGYVGVARVTQINYVDFFVKLRVVIGSQDIFDRVPVPLVFPGAGTRHFLGSMPEVGDYCVVTWQPQESGADNKGTKTPVIIGWLLPGVWAGKEWMTTQGYPVDEHDMGSQHDREIVRGVYDRIRHKLRHMEPGNIVASSGQGSDLVLDEGVLLANRRCNELRLRDQDQALVVRSLQQFHAMAGARIYSGMVQRDAATLATTMVSDGFEWDDDLQTVFNEPVPEGDLLPSEEPEGFLTPADPLMRGEKESVEGFLGTPLFGLPPNLDPYVFLRRGGFIDETGYVVDERHRSNAVYGGKSIFRVASQSADNTTIKADADTLTEWRLEMTHTADGRLPVTEQTDMFDAERLPAGDPDVSSPVSGNPNRPFLQFVLGSVVGNDPFSQVGRTQYGFPLVPIIFDGNQASPRLAPARLIQDPSSAEAPTPIGEHAASLFQMSPPISGGGPDTFWSVNKKGQLRISIGGPAAENSVEAALTGGLKLSVAGSFDFLLRDSVRLGSEAGNSFDNVGAEIFSRRGAVRIFGGGSVTGAEGVLQRISGSEEGESDLPSVDVQAQTNLRLQAQRKALIKGSSAEINAARVEVKGLQDVVIGSADHVGIQGKKIDISSGGKCTSSFGGPEDNLPTNAPLHEETYSPSIPGPTITVHKVSYNGGSREEKFTSGNHTTEITVGNMTYKTAAGTWEAQAGGNKLTMGVSSLEARIVGSGGIQLNADAGAATLKGQLSVRVESSAGPATVAGTSVILQAPVDNNAGGIVCGGSIDPLTGNPFSTFGIGAKNHIVSG